MRIIFKRIIALAMVLLLLPLPAMASNPITVYLNGQLLESDALPFISQDRVMVPFRVLGEGLGAQIEWDESTSRVTFVKDSRQLNMTIGKTDYSINGETAYLDTPPVVRNNRTFVPLRFVSEALESPVEWDAMRRSAYVGATPATRLDPSRPMLALTFDDGPAPGKTERILEALRAVDGRATFFVVGSSVVSSPESVWAIAAKGNEIGNHTYGHPNMTQISAETLQYQLQATDEAILNITGERPTLIRPTYGAVNPYVQGMVDRPLILWNVDTNDWYTRNSQATVNHVLHHAHDGAIILMHDIHEPTIQACLEVIPKLVEQGYQLVTVSELMAAKGLTANPGQLITHG